MTMNNQRVAIIGGSSGIGLALAQAAAEQGAEVVIASSSSRRLHDALAQLPQSSSGQVVDVRREAELAAFFERLARFDHLAITAGDALAPQTIRSVDLDDARRALDVRFWGAIAAIKHATGHLTSGGSITLTSGMVAVRPNPDAALASAGAAAVEGLVRGLAVELAPVRVNAVRPGVVRTPMWDGIGREEREDLFAMLAGRTMTGSIASAADASAAYLYLMGNSSVTGTVMTVDNGALLS